MGRTGLITGASKGLGGVLGPFLAAQGYDLIITARTVAPLEAKAEELRALGVRVAAMEGDISDASHRQRLFVAARSLGGLDLLINNASELGPSPLANLAELPPERLRHVFEVNVFAALTLVKELLPLLSKRESLVVNISSDAAVGGYAGWGAYGASKAALDLLSKTLAAELRTDGVAVVSVDPGDMRTDMHQAAFPGEDISDRPEPEITLPFWAWLLGQDPMEVSGQRFEAQAEEWLLPA